MQSYYLLQNFKYFQARMSFFTPTFLNNLALFKKNLRFKISVEQKHIFNETSDDWMWEAHK